MEKHTHYYHIDQRVSEKSRDREVFAWCHCGKHIPADQIESILNQQLADTTQKIIPPPPESTQRKIRITESKHEEWDE